MINARDAMREGGKRTIETANAHLDEVYAAKHDEVVAGQYALIVVTDTGTGMTPEIAARAFEPFYTTKEIGQGSGSGLGLSQVFGFVKQSGGHMKIYSEIGRGTSVKIYLPRYFGEVSPQPERSDTPEALPRAQQEETVLIVEDEAEVRAYSSDVLTQFGYRVIEAEDAHAGLAALEANPALVGSERQSVASLCHGLPVTPSKIIWPRLSRVHNARWKDGAALVGRCSECSTQEVRRRRRGRPGMSETVLSILPGCCRGTGTWLAHLPGIDIVTETPHTIKVSGSAPARSHRRTFFLNCEALVGFCNVS